jgi:hypothetical protein
MVGVVRIFESVWLEKEIHIAHMEYEGNEMQVQGWKLDSNPRLESF